LYDYQFKKLYWGGNALLLIGLFLFNVSALIGQNNFCGTASISEQALAQRFTAVGFIPGSTQTASSIQTSYSIPIKTIVIRSGGVSNFPDPRFWMDEAIRWMNERFKSQNISFYQCNYWQIEDPSYYSFSKNSNALIELTDLYGDAQALNVFIVGDIIGAAGVYVTRSNNVVNNAVALDAGSYSAMSNLAHEVGHFLGLVHTHENTEGSITCSTAVVPKFRGDNTCFSSFCSCTSAPDGCTSETTGDRIPDTPIDPYDSEVACAISLNCGDVCQIAFNLDCRNETLTFTPPHDNIMSYYREPCKTRFSPKQLEVMKRMLNTDPGYAFLRDQILPSCQTIPNSFATKGKVNFWYDADGTGPNAEALVAFPGLKVSIDQNGNQCVSTTDAVGEYNICASSGTGQNYHFGPDILTETAVWNQPITGLSTMDVVQVQRYINPNVYRSFHNYHLIAADVDANGIIETADADKIRNVVLNVSPGFGFVPTWRFVPEALIWGDDPNTWLTQRTIIQGNSTQRTDPLRNDWVDYNGIFKQYNTSNTYFGRPAFTAPNRQSANNRLWNFTGVKTGDVNFSTSIFPTQFRTPDISTSYNSGPALRGSEAKLSIKKGESFTVLVTVKPKGKAMNILGYQMGLKINPESAELSGVSPGEVRKFEMDAFALESQEKGVIKTLWYDNEPIKLSGEKVLFEVALNAKADISDLAQAISLSPQALQPEFVSDQEELLAPEIGFKVKNGQNAFSTRIPHPKFSKNSI
jgi:Cohesin domain